jgi:hypothetical protein
MKNLLGLWAEFCLLMSFGALGGFFGVVLFFSLTGTYSLHMYYNGHPDDGITAVIRFTIATGMILFYGLASLLVP